MMSVTIVENLFPERIAEGLKAAHDAEEAAKNTIADRARERVPVLTGATQESIQVTADGVEAGEASIFLEFGTVKMAPHPFFLQGVPEGEAAADNRLRFAFRG
jgi:HK97 gp10 family phage protein